MRQYFSGVEGDPPIASGSGLVSTSEELLWAPTDFTRIAANEARAGKIWIVRAGGVCTTATAGLLSITPRMGLLISSPTLGVTVVPLNVPGTATTANAWALEFRLICRTIGAAGANSTFFGTGFLQIGNLATAGTAAIIIGFGGTVATADASIATGVAMGKTLTVAGSFTTGYAFIEPLN
jgi:hypothetical protein